ncbi:MAG: hypothetical protein INQ03_22460 [Candidatus Heimdallarchaeota archaeon]|nr:hypothetical protein [Candidatus Heimdallarchaeota archaeon]
MMEQKSWIIKAIFYLLIMVVLGLIVSSGINGFIAISFEDKTLPEFEYSVVTPSTQQLPTFGTVVGIIEPAISNDVIDTGIAELVALVNTTGDTKVYTPTDTIPAGRVISIGEQTRNAFSISISDLDMHENFSSDSFMMVSYQQGTNDVLAIVGGSQLSDAYGLFWLIEELNTGTTLTNQDVFTYNGTIIPEIEHRFVKQGGVGMNTDWDSETKVEEYSLNDRDFENLYLVDAPYINDTELQLVKEQFRTYLTRMIRFGYNSIIMNGFLQFINFDTLEDNQYAVYAEDSHFRARQLAQRAAFDELYQYADNLGFNVYAYSDMVALTEELEEYLIETIGSVDAHNQDLWDVYANGLEELFTVMPYLKGFMIRIGEAGSTYNFEGQFYTSELYVKDVASVQLMLNTFIDIGETMDKNIIFRTWSVGVGGAGDMHTNPETYDKIFAGVDNSDNFMVSTKFVQGDFYSYHPFNPTLFSGDEKRIIEFQSRREFEGVNAFPNYMGDEHQQALQYFLDNNANVHGVWVWTQYGGPMRAGPLSIYPFHGNWELIDMNVYATAKILWDVDVDMESVTKNWVSATFTSSDADFVDNFTSMLLLSRDAIMKGLYISNFASERVRAFGLEPPPMLWIFEWDLVTGVSSVMSSIYVLCKDDLEASIAEGYEAVDTVVDMQGLIAGYEDTLTVGKDLYNQVLLALDYEFSLFQTLAYYRDYILNYYAWVDTGDESYKTAYEEVLPLFQAQVDSHMEDYEDNLYFPAYDFTEVDVAIGHYERNSYDIIVSRIMFIIYVLLLLFNIPFIEQKIPIATNIHKFLFYGTFMPWKLREEEASKKETSVMISYTTAGLVVLCLLLSDAGLMFLLSMVLLLQFRIIVVNLLFRDSKNVLISSLAPTNTLYAFIYALMFIRGPSHFWFLFWAENAFRSTFFTLFILLIFWQYFTIAAVSKESLLKKIAGSLLQFGSWIVLGGTILAIPNLERSLVVANKELILIPFGLGDILGITVHLDIPLSVPYYVMGFGGAIDVIGAVLNYISRKSIINED